MWIDPIRLNEVEEPAKQALEEIRAERGAVPKILLSVGRRPRILRGRQTMEHGRARWQLLSW